MPSLARRLTAEALGTFGLVFVGAAVVVVNGGFPNSGIGLLGIALAHAVVLSVMITATMTISGGHLNPAVTIGLLAADESSRYPPRLHPAQLVAACWPPSWSSCCFLSGRPRCHAGGPGDRQLRDAGPGDRDRADSDVLPDISRVRHRRLARAPRVGGFGIGLVLLFDILVGGPAHWRRHEPGAGLWPGRWFRASGWDRLVYWIGPIAGALLAALLWEYLLLPQGPPRRRKTD